ncbi:hypothetical protein LC653_09360 [Nostoc sp. CHAB 5784]|uniref:hypothetical protein n=1 Tax=Nostoc mirabile TaxID=2907820 RepID=UPI001E33D8CF|nr:hypothetical protein [Nostoc mirabile]MCC5664121.1 hypothetical protein [Nostoc mirabile CHAB5784]
MINIKNYSLTAASSVVEACGRDLPGRPDETGNRPLSWHIQDCLSSIERNTDTTNQQDYEGANR